MGKASKWFRGLLGLKKPDPQQPQPPPDSTKAKPPKKKWTFVKSYREKDQQPRGLAVTDNEDDPARHAIAVAEATAVAAVIAREAAQVAAKMVRLTSSGRNISSNATNTARVTSFGTGNAAAVAVLQANVGVYDGGYGDRAEWAAVLIQSHFRAYLARRALRALKALVKLQAIVRGRIERRNNTAGILRQMQMRELLRAHTLGSAGRAGLFESPHKANHIHYLGPATPEKFEHMERSTSMKHGENLMYRRNGSKKNKSGSNQNCRVAFKSWEMEGSNVKSGSRYDEMNDKILEIDNGKPQVMPKRRSLFHSSHLSIGSDQYSHSFTTSKDSTAHRTVPSLSSFEVQSLTSPLQFSRDVDQDLFCTAENSPQFHSVSSKDDNPRRGPFTPTRSDGSRSCLSGYSDYPNYMSCTESSKAKIRSLSAPKQRPQYERSSSAKRFSIHGFYEARVNPQKVSTLHANFTSKAYPGSGRLDRLGVPVRAEAVGFSGDLWHRF